MDDDLTDDDSTDDGSTDESSVDGDAMTAISNRNFGLALTVVLRELQSGKLVLMRESTILRLEQMLNGHGRLLDELDSMRAKSRAEALADSRIKTIGALHKTIKMELVTLIFLVGLLVCYLLLTPLYRALLG